MHEGVTSTLKAWETFYVIVGSSAGALTGLQFVVLTLVAEAGMARSKDSLAAFGSPNVVHFCSALLVAAILSAPWGALLQAGLAVAGCGVLGVIYSAVVLKRARRQRAYQPVWEDWIWHFMLPFVAYSTLIGTGVALEWAGGALFVLGAAVLLLVFIGIHNAWDTVTYVTAQGEMREQEAEKRAGARPEERADAGAARNPDPAPVAARGPAPGPGTAPDTGSGGGSPGPGAAA